MARANRKRNEAKRQPPPKDAPERARDRQVVMYGGPHGQRPKRSERVETPKGG